MPTPISDEMMRHMIEEGYIVASDEQTSDGEMLFEFGKIPPLSDYDARLLFFELYREASKYHLVAGKVYKMNQKKPKSMKGRRYHRRK